MSKRKKWDDGTYAKGWRKSPEDAIGQFNESIPTEQELRWRHLGYLDCLRGLSIEGAPDPKFVLWLCEKTGASLISLTYLEDLRRKLGAQTAG